MSAPGHEAIRVAIAAVIKRVPSIGRVHAYQRYDKNASSLAALYRDEIDGVAQLRGWNVSRISEATQSPSLGRFDRRTEWDVRGYMALDDAAETELVFDGLLDALTAAFLADETLGGVVATTVMEDGQAGLQIIEAVPVMFCGVLCHSVRARLSTRLIF